MYRAGFWTRGRSGSIWGQSDDMTRRILPTHLLCQLPTGAPACTQLALTMCTQLALTTFEQSFPRRSRQLSPRLYVIFCGTVLQKLRTNENLLAGG
ncbi:MAG: hypothetical protein DRJ50_11550 [Actinobacteria bacterium]|nr:MAG: hypothetical protein DRJ50_11550 [Actinomycetota bacterium]